MGEKGLQVGFAAGGKEGLSPLLSRFSGEFSYALPHDGLPLQRVTMNKLLSHMKIERGPLVLCLIVAGLDNVLIILG